MTKRYKFGIGLVLIVSVLVLFVSAGVPMPKSVLSAKKFAAQVAALAVPVLTSFPLTPELNLQAFSQVPQASGTELINRLCTRII